MQVKLKEKDQEVKLNDLKVKELKKQVPNTRLRPLKNKRKTVDSGSQNLSKGGLMMKNGSERELIPMT